MLLIVDLMRRIPLTLRALVLVPLLAVLVDSTRATLACARRPRRAWRPPAARLGAAGIALLGVYSVLLRARRRAVRGAPPPVTGRRRSPGCG